ncbi:MAG: glycosyltransferase [Phascolarctobacterium sp.]|uniref:glycosyltransferase n=1 Tax=Phascolarctobacterium sp. TaxID=2049039 RepID=UPI0026DC553B|nr:glycosyltransferase [Phascolarctobacterium sp.]MDO4921262.1 glycosyltransferase [Phascolarctobacterium sp.]
MAKRILWLFNHTSLRKFEVPMLISMGYEVYCPKKWNIFDFSASISYEYDSSLTIPQEVLDQLNNINFYECLSIDTIEVLNKYFDIAICMLNINMLEVLAKHFKGAICLHAFGLEKSLTYTNYLGIRTLEMLMDCGNRFWFLPTYSNLQEIECTFLQRRSLFVPIGLADSTVKNTWIGGEKKFLFVSPKIKVNTYYNKVYNDFKKCFGDLPHIIAGAQPIPVNEDKNVKGFMSNDEYEYNMNHLAGMYYHSREPYHLHYHPLEAIRQGMPLIFMGGGMLDYLGGVNLPGRAKTINEARKKLKGLLNGDTSFVKDVIETQTVLLGWFKVSYCKPIWEQAMKKIEESLSMYDIVKGSNNNRIAIILPAPYTGGVLDYSIRFALNIHNEIKRQGDAAEIIFAYPENKIYKDKDYFSVLKKENVQLRSFVYSEEPVSRVYKIMKIAGLESRHRVNLPFPTYAVLKDGISDFQDCKHLIFTADAGNVISPFFCLRPFSVVVHDYIQRYVPESVSRESNVIKLTNQKSANSVFVTSRATMEDAIQFANLESDKVVLTPLLLELPEKPAYLSDCKENYLLWPTNAAPHKNHLRALRALEQYYHNGGKFECFITGANSKYLKPGMNLAQAPVSVEYVEKVQEFIQNSQELKRHLHFQGDMMKNEFWKLLNNAKFVFHPGYGDNGSGSVIDAAGYGIPSLSSDYPAMRYLADFFGIPIQYVDPFNVEMMESALFDMEKNCDIYAKKIPKREKLVLNEYRKQACKLYQCIKETIGF